MKRANIKKAYLTAVSLLLAGLIFSCYGLGFAKILKDTSHHAQKQSRATCCDFNQASSAAVFGHTFFMAPSAYQLGIFSAGQPVFALIFLMVVFAIIRFILYEHLIRLFFGSARLFNYLILALSRGLLHPKIF